MKKRYKALIIIAAIALVVLILFAIYTSRGVAIKRRFGITLPKYVEVIEYEYSVFGDELCLKAGFDEENYEALTELLQNIHRSSERTVDEKFRVPWADGDADWWDIDASEIVYVIEGARRGSGNVKCMRELWAVITQSSDGEYYLYITD